MLCRETVPFGDFGVARLATVQSPALGQELRPGGTVNGPVDPSPAKQRCVGGIDDGIHIQRGNVRLDDLDHAIHDFSDWIIQDLSYFFRYIGNPKRLLNEAVTALLQYLSGFAISAVAAGENHLQAGVNLTSAVKVLSASHARHDHARITRSISFPFSMNIASAS